jgi:hypothetical protein
MDADLPVFYRMHSPEPQDPKSRLERRKVAWRKGAPSVVTDEHRNFVAGMAQTAKETSQMQRELEVGRKRMESGQAVKAIIDQQQGLGDALTQLATPSVVLHNAQAPQDIVVPPSSQPPQPPAEEAVPCAVETRRLVQPPLQRPPQPQPCRLKRHHCALDAAGSGSEEAVAGTATAASSIASTAFSATGSSPVARTANAVASAGSTVASTGSTVASAATHRLGHRGRPLTVRVIGPRPQHQQHPRRPHPEQRQQRRAQSRSFKLARSFAASRSPRASCPAEPAAPSPSARGTAETCWRAAARLRAEEMLAGLSPDDMQRVYWALSQYAEIQRGFHEKKGHASRMARHVDERLSSVEQ